MRPRKLPRWADVTHYQVGDVFWHGTSMRYGITDLQRPSWVSNSHAVASWFSKWKSDGQPDEPIRVMKYEVVKPFTLPTYNGYGLQQLPDGGAGRMDFEAWIGALLGHHPDDHAYEADTPFGLMEAADDLCRLNGFAGWRIVNNYASGDDILICKPDLVLRRVQAGWQRRPR